jgi:tetratricopeptide (TPR) repeat protein
LTCIKGKKPRIDKFGSNILLRFLSNTVFTKILTAAGALALVLGVAGSSLPMGGVPESTAPASIPFQTSVLADCLDDVSPATIVDYRAKAERVIRSCSEAIQSHTLSMADLAGARLNRATARTVLGDGILAAGDYLEALRHYQAAIDPMNPDALQLYRMGAASEGLGDSNSALRQYDQAIKVDPKLALAYYGRGILLATRERAYRRAIADFDKVLRLEPTNVSAFIRRGEAYSQIGDFGHALADLNRALDLDAANPAAYVARGLINGRHGDSSKALQDFDVALQLNSREASALRNRGALYAKLGQHDRAIRDFDTVVAIAPNDPIAFFDRGYALFGKKQYELAVVDYSTAISLDPVLGPAYLNRCLVLTIQGRELVKALADCDQALKLMPVSVAARQTRGFIYLKLGDPAIASVEYEAALQIDPNSALALYGLGLAKLRLGREEEGKVDQAAAKTLVPSIKGEFSDYGVE